MSSGLPSSDGNPLTTQKLGILRFFDPLLFRDGLDTCVGRQGPPTPLSTHAGGPLPPVRHKDSSVDGQTDDSKDFRPVNDSDRPDFRENGVDGRRDPRVPHPRSPDSPRPSATTPGLSCREGLGSPRNRSRSFPDSDGSLFPLG